MTAALLIDKRSAVAGCLNSTFARRVKHALDSAGLMKPGKV